MKFAEEPEEVEMPREEEQHESALDVESTHLDQTFDKSTYSEPHQTAYDQYQHYQYNDEHNYAYSTETYGQQYGLEEEKQEQNFPLGHFGGSVQTNMNMQGDEFDDQIQF